jgi:2-polyprenylphenol 6-hydroxylase
MNLEKDMGTDYDVVIVGTGMVGLTLACCLKDQDLRIALINKDLLNKKKLTQASRQRVIAVTLGSQRLLEQLNVWQRLDKKHYAPFRRMQVWESGQSSQLFFDSADMGLATLGYIVKNYDLGHALCAQAKTDSELTWLIPDTLMALQQEENHVVITLASGKEIRTRLLVGADGAQSKVRQLADFYIKSTDYQQRALIATVQTEWAHDQTARQIFLAEGPLAFLPLTDAHYCSIVWSSTPEEIERLAALDDVFFCEELTHAFEHCLGEVISTSARFSYPLKTQETEQYIKSNIALIGDAAHIIHPLAGQGANLGIADAKRLAKVILEAKQRHRNIGAWYTLRRYERERRFHNRVMLGSVDGIKHLFAATHPMLQKTRQWGLNVINKTNCLKNFISRYAIGDFKV